MSTVPQTSLAMALKALGAEDGAEAARLEAQLRANPALGALEDEWAERLAHLADEVPEAMAPDGMMDRIDAALDREAGPDNRTVRADGGRWRERSPGVWMKLLDESAETGIRSYMLRCAPGAEIAPHRHARDEHIFVLEGSIALGDLLLNAGDYHVAKRDSLHPVARTEDGCLVLVRC